MRPLFGPAGNSDSFFAQGGKGLPDVPGYITRMGLDVYEYQGGHGIRISEVSARAFGSAAKAAGIRLSVHAPYYISLASAQEEKRMNSVRYILESARAADFMGAERVVVHPGSCGKMPREEALALASDTLAHALAVLDAQGLSHIHICPETMGKLGQLGTLEEVLRLCSLDDRLIPCIDFGHINARTFGGLKTTADFADMLDRIGEILGAERLKTFHAHFSKIAYTKGGEKCHLTFEDTAYGPEFEPLAEAISQRRCAPVIICESAGTQAEDAQTMKRIYKTTAEGE